MHETTRGGAVDAMKWLKSQGADINAQDNDGQTPRHRAETENTEETEERFRYNGGQRDEARPSSR